MVLDKNAGRNVRYKSRAGVQSSLSVHEKMYLESISCYKYQTDSLRSRLNRYRNKREYDLE